MNDINTQQLLAKMQQMADQAKATSSNQAVKNNHPEFADALSQAVDKVNETLTTSGKLVTAYQKGEPGVDLTDVMIAKQKASIAFEAMIQVRKRLVSAYQDIIKMAI